MSSRDKVALSSVITSLILLVTSTEGQPLHSLVSRQVSLKTNYSSPSVFLTVSSLRKRVKQNVYKDRDLELNWFNAPNGMDNDPTSWVGLFDHDPLQSIANPLVQVYTKDHPEGHYKTNVTFHRLTFSPDKLPSSCLGYWIGYVNQNRLLSSSCISARPNWMYEMRDIIGDRTLPEIMIPGTHNSGSYDTRDPPVETVVTRYQMCQDETLFNQLVYGIRYLDIRASYRRVNGQNEKIWISHGFLRTDVGITDAVAQVKAFLQATNEIVIMDFHLFDNGFTGTKEAQRHKELIDLLERELGDYMVPRRYGHFATLNDLWKNGKRLLVGYATDYHKTSELLLPRIRHVWPEKDTFKEFEAFLNARMCLHYSETLWAAMAELTPSGVGVVLDRYGGLRKMADQVNRHVTTWFRDRWWHCSNIIATDFFLGNNIIEVSIVSNYRRRTEKRFPPY